MILRELAVPGRQTALATAIGSSQTTVSNIKTDGRLEASIQYLYHLGFKVVPTEYKCIPEVQARAWFDSHQREVAKQAQTQNLWADE